MDFISSFCAPSEVFETDLMFVARGNDVMIETRDGSASIPRYAALKNRHSFLTVQYLGLLDGVHCYAGAISGEDNLPEGTAFTPLRALYGVVDESLFWTAARALHLVKWDLETRYCSTCGAPVAFHVTERAKHCNACNRTVYPVISPAVITAIAKGDLLLLLNHQRSPEGFYALLAGFVEPGESLEQAVVRETLEETGITIRNVRYFGNQPWGFSNALMVGFTAEYESGEFRLQDSEIRDAAWFKVEDLPKMRARFGNAAGLSLTWQMIKHFEDTHGN